MKAISFKLSGKTAFFKKPDVNSYAYFTYNNIHKPALLGMLGAIIGLGGYTQLFDENRKRKENKEPLNDGYPKFYEKLKDFKVSITPLAKHGYFSKKIQIFNNSVGYASKEMGGNLIVREQWLEEPKWQIMILEDKSSEYQKLKEYLQNQKCEFIPYLGKNEHFANISEVDEVELSEEFFLEDGNYIDSLFIGEDINVNGFEREGEEPFLFQEYAPNALQKKYHFYEYQKLIFTNIEVNKFPNDTYSYKDKNYSFI